MNELSLIKAALVGAIPGISDITDITVGTYVGFSAGHFRIFIGKDQISYGDYLYSIYRDDELGEELETYSFKECIDYIKNHSDMVKPNE